jgi:hypothetical protein
MKFVMNSLEIVVLLLLTVMVLASAGCFHGDGDGGREGDRHEQHDDHHDDDHGHR